MGGGAGEEPVAMTKRRASIRRSPAATARAMGATGFAGEGRTVAARHGFAHVPGPQAAAFTMGGAAGLYLLIAVGLAVALHPVEAYRCPFDRELGNAT